MKRLLVSLFLSCAIALLTAPLVAGATTAIHVRTGNTISASKALPFGSHDLGRVLVLSDRGFGRQKVVVDSAYGFEPESHVVLTASTTAKNSSAKDSRSSKRDAKSKTKKNTSSKKKTSTKRTSKKSDKTSKKPTKSKTGRYVHSKKKAVKKGDKKVKKSTKSKTKKNTSSKKKTSTKRTSKKSDKKTRKKSSSSVKRKTTVPKTTTSKSSSTKSIDKKTSGHTSSGNHSTPTTTTRAVSVKKTSPTTTLTKPAGGSISGQKVLFKYSGTKSIITPSFSVPPGGWNLKYSYTCNPAGSLLQFTVYQNKELDVNDLGPDIENQGVGQGISSYYVDNGNFDIHVANYHCSKWSLTVIEK